MKYRKISRGTSRKLAKFFNKRQLNRLGVKYETTNGSPIINKRVVDVYGDEISVKFEDASRCSVRPDPDTFNLSDLLQSSTKEQFLCLSMRVFRGQELYYRLSNEVVRVLLKSSIEITRTLLSFELKSELIIIFDINGCSIKVFDKVTYTIINKFAINEEAINDFNNYITDEISKREIK